MNKKEIKKEIVAQQLRINAQKRTAISTFSKFGTDNFLVQSNVNETEQLIKNNETLKRRFSIIELSDRYTNILQRTKKLQNTLPKIDLNALRKTEDFYHNLTDLKEEIEEEIQTVEEYEKNGGLECLPSGHGNHPEEEETLSHGLEQQRLRRIIFEWVPQFIPDAASDVLPSLSGR